MSKKPETQKSAKDWQQKLPRSFTAGSSRPCVVCDNADIDVRYLRFRRVSGAIVVAHAHDEWGFLCRKCARRMYLGSQAHNLALGWWGLAGLLYHNPVAIVSNTLMLMRGPRELTRADIKYINEYLKKTRPR